MAETPDAVQAAVDAVLSKEWKPDTPWSVHSKHRYDSDCAVCREDVPAVVAAALEAAAPILAAHVRRETLRDVAEGRVTLEEQAAAQGHTTPQRIEDLHTDLDLTPEEMEAFISGLDEPDSDAEIRADERRQVAEEIAAALDEKSLTVQQEAKEFAALENVAAKLLARAGALANAAVIAREIGEARDSR